MWVTSCPPYASSVIQAVLICVTISAEASWVTRAGKESAGGLLSGFLYFGVKVTIITYDHSTLARVSHVAPLSSEIWMPLLQIPDRGGELDIGAVSSVYHKHNRRHEERKGKIG